jgi:small-conductance mechanosensitive channel
VVLVIGKVIIRQSINKIALKFGFALARIHVTHRIVNILFVFLALIILAGIWGLDQRGLVLFITSTLTVLGIAFFAQWSILSNITAGLVLFFNHPLRIGDNIRIFEKDFEIKGTLKDISIFFLHIQTQEGNNVTMPNTVALQKMISVLPKGGNVQNRTSTNLRFGEIRANRRKITG